LSLCAARRILCLPILHGAWGGWLHASCLPGPPLRRRGRSYLWRDASMAVLVRGIDSSFVFLADVSSSCRAKIAQNGRFSRSIDLM